MFHRGAISRAKIVSEKALFEAERRYRKYPGGEVVPFAIGTSYTELAYTVFPDPCGCPMTEHPLYCIETFHKAAIGAEELAEKTRQWLEEKRKDQEIEILSVCSGFNGRDLSLTVLIRAFKDESIPDFSELFEYLGETGDDDEPDSLEEEIRETIDEKSIADDPASLIAVRSQQKLYQETPPDVPFLNRLSRYVPECAGTSEARIYRASAYYKDIDVRTPYKKFMEIFRECIRYLRGVEKNRSIEVLKGTVGRKEFEAVVDEYLKNTFVRPGILPLEDTFEMKKRINNALFDLYLIQDLISGEPAITDIKITAPDAVRFRMYGKSYLSDICFVDDEDYFKFVEGLAVRNGVELSASTQTFTDTRDPDYILRFSLTASYVTSSGYPIVHVRKIPRKKPMSEDLIKAGMMDEKIRDYLLDCGKKSSGVIFAGPPGSGKTTILNWFLEDAYNDSDDILVIQESDELYSYRKGVMFEHVVTNPKGEEEACSMEDLAKNALVAGANVFVIGEAKGAEICSAITLANSGCRTALTIHSPSAKETVNKMADLALRGTADSFDRAKRMTKCFDTIVYLDGYKVREILKITGYDEEKHDMVYKAIYSAEQA